MLSAGKVGQGLWN